MGYVYTTLKEEVTEEVVNGGYCDRCGDWLEVLWEDAANLDGGTVVTMEGWYGGWIDNLFGNYEALLCSECSSFIWGEMFKNVPDAQNPGEYRSDPQSEQ